MSPELRVDSLAETMTRDPVDDVFADSCIQSIQVGTEGARQQPTDPAAETGPPAAAGPRPGLPHELAAAVEDKPYQMTDDEVAVARFLVAQGHNQREVARLLGRGRMAVHRAIRREDARTVLSRHQRRLALDWVRAARIAAREGNHEPAQAALEAIGAVDVPQGAAGGGIQVNVGVALPGTPGAPTA